MKIEKDEDPDDKIWGDIAINKFLRPNKHILTGDDYYKIKGTEEVGLVLEKMDCTLEDII